MLSMRFNIIIPKRGFRALQQNESQISRETMETLLDGEIGSIFHMQSNNYSLSGPFLCLSKHQKCAVFHKLICVSPICELLYF